MIETYARFEDIQYEIVRLLRSAKSSVFICVAWINEQIYGQVLRDLAARGVTVKVVYNSDAKNAAHGVQASQGVNVYAVSARRGNALMHDKFCIIDNEILINGSYNWSQNAPNSFENIVVIKNDFKLIKSFLHEFEDLLNFYIFRATHKVSKCKVCRSSVFNVGILGTEGGKYSESQVDVWSVCVKNRHVVQLNTEFYQYLEAQLGLVDERDRDDEIDDHKQAMVDEFDDERAKIKRLQNFFANQFQNRIHALGKVAMENEIQHLKFNASPDYVVRVFWRDMYYRKIIPSMLHEFDGDIDKIIDEHK